MNIAQSIVLTGLVLGVAGSGVNSAKAGDADPSWSGFYAGANIGYGWDSGDVGLSPHTAISDLVPVVEAIVRAGSFPTSLSPDARGVAGGGQAGYNWELPSGWVVGVETDLQASGIKGSTSATIIDPHYFDEDLGQNVFFDSTRTAVSKKVNWYGTVRARAGYLLDPQWLVYATGGLAYGKTSLGFHVEDLAQGCLPDATICGDGSKSGVRLGWSLGAGVETMLAPNWSLKAEYLYVDLGKRSFDASTITPVDFKLSAKYHEQTVRIGLNYHFN
jgi:outer membrane immunogenic protein